MGNAEAEPLRSGVLSDTMVGVLENSLAVLKVDDPLVILPAGSVISS
jgi:hypothetical protein